MGSGTLKVRYSHALYRRVGAEFAKPLGLRNEMIVSSFIYVSFEWVIGTKVSL